jgi:hypothetical protein
MFAEKESDDYAGHLTRRESLWRKSAAVGSWTVTTLDVFKIEVEPGSATKIKYLNPAPRC